MSQPEFLLLSVSRLTSPCRDRNLSLKLFFRLNKFFHVAIICVATEEDSIATEEDSFKTEILPYVLHYVAT